MEEYLGYEFGKLKIPCHVFEENLDPGFGFEDVIIEYDADPRHFRLDENQQLLYDPKVVLPKDIYESMQSLVERRKKEAEARGAPFFDGQMVKLKDYGIKVEKEDIITEKEKLILKLAPTSWFTYQATNYSLDQPNLKDERGNSTIREKYKINVLNLNDILANPIGVSANIISEPDQVVLLVERSEKLAQYPGRYGVAAAGFMQRTKDLVDGKPNPFKTIQREIEEEAGIKCSINDFKLFSVGRAVDDLHGELFGELRTNYTVQEIKSAPKKSKYEALRLFEVPFKPEEVLPYLLRQKEVLGKVLDPKSGEVTTWVPAHAVAVIQSLLKDYGYENVLNSLNKLY